MARGPSDASFGDDIVYGDIMRLTVYLVKDLKIICDSNFDSPGVVQEPVVISFAATDTIAFAVVGYGGHDYHIDIGDVGEVIAIGLLNIK